MFIQEQLGIMPSKIFILNGHQCNLLAKDWNQTLLIGLDLNNGEKEMDQGYFIMKYLNLCIINTEAI